MLYHCRRGGLRRLACLIPASQIKTPPNEQGRFKVQSRAGEREPSLLLEEARELLLEPRHAAAAIEQLLGAADPGPDDMVEKLPQQLQDLISRSMALQAKVRRLDTTIHAPAAERAAIGNPLVPQLNRLKAAFER